MQDTLDATAARPEPARPDAECPVVRAEERPGARPSLGYPAPVPMPGLALAEPPADRQSTRAHRGAR